MKSCIIIGSGIAGLASAIRVAKLGYQVSVYEANESFGGKIDEVTLGGYRFDKGPSLFTLPNLVDELFTLCNENASDFFEYDKLDHSCNYYWADGTRFKMYIDESDLKSEFKSAFNSDYKIFKTRLKKAESRYNRIGEIFTGRSLHKMGSWFKLDVLKALLHIRSYGLFTTMAKENRKTLTNPQVEQIFNRYATYNGSNPYQAPALLNMIPHLEHNIGTFFPKKGIRSIAKSLYELALRQGVVFKFNSKVQDIVIENDKAAGIKLDDKLIHSDLVISNVDVHYTYHNLLPPEYLNHKLLSQERSSSAVIFYWGVNKIYPTIELHNILFSSNYEAEFEHLFKLKSCYSDPTVYIHVSSKNAPSDAPNGCENWFVMVNAPASDKINWEQQLPEIRQHVLKKIHDNIDLNFEENIVQEASLTPDQIDQNTASFLGSLYGTSSNSKYAAFRRQSNQHKKIKNLYFCGGSVHPGGGIPLCLKSAKIVSSLILKNDN